MVGSARQNVVITDAPLKPAITLAALQSEEVRVPSMSFSYHEMPISFHTGSKRE
jgi:hypothetical protein